jgi:eukaryotic-like serine/threonine-protein kinase
MTLEAEQLIGQAIGPYTVDRLIGQGGFAWVFAGHATGTGVPAAVKVLKPRYAGDPQLESRFRNEAKVASELDHPNIVRILEIAKTNEITYFAMDLYADSLASRLSRDGPLREDALIAVAQDITRALAFAHHAGIVHRDIKVDNVLFASDGRAVIADFGIARAVSGYATATGVNMTIGTPHYVSPEQAQGGPLDGRSDLYALGVTLYKAATGELPFRSNDWFELARMHVEDAPPPPRARRPDLSARVERIILRCLAKHPDDRYASADELLAELDAIGQRDRGPSATRISQYRSASDQS